MSANEHIVRIEHDLTDEALERLAARAVELLAPRIELALLPEWMKLPQAAAFFGVHPDTVEKWGRRGTIERFKADNVVLYNVRSIRGNTPSLREVAS